VYKHKFVQNVLIVFSIKELYSLVHSHDISCYKFVQQTTMYFNISYAIALIHVNFMKHRCARHVSCADGSKHYRVMPPWTQLCQSGESVYNGTRLCSKLQHFLYDWNKTLKSHSVTKLLFVLYLDLQMYAVISALDNPCLPVSLPTNYYVKSSPQKRNSGI